MDDLYLPYSFIYIDGQKSVKISDPPQIMTASELFQWMKEVRDEDSDLYHELVKIYFKLRKSDETTH